MSKPNLCDQERALAVGLLHMAGCVSLQITSVANLLRTPKPDPASLSTCAERLRVASALLDTMAVTLETMEGDQDVKLINALQTGHNLRLVCTEESFELFSSVGDLGNVPSELDHADKSKVIADLEKIQMAVSRAVYAMATKNGIDQTLSHFISNSGIVFTQR